MKEETVLGIFTVQTNWSIWDKFQMMPQFS